ncbi:MAG: hypothetical protein ACFB2W_07800 [Leptolyngbyaceae cyanobacterium]
MATYLFIAPLLWVALPTQMALQPYIIAKQAAITSAVATLILDIA